MLSHHYGRDGFIWFTGVVEDRNDPEKLGRVRVRIFSYHSEDKTKIPTHDLHWAYIVYPVTTPSMDGMGTTPSFLVEGSQVLGFFRDPEEFQEPIILGTIPGVASSKADTNKGFNDPAGTYPKKIFEPDTNRLGVANPEKPHEILSKKEQNRTTDVDALTGNTWSEPKSTYNARYPKNHVFESESGHIVEYDDTPKAERIHEYHKSGTFYEIDADGNKVTRIVKDNYEITAGDDYVNIKGNAQLKVNNDYDIKVGNSISIGNSDATVAIIFKRIVTILEHVTNSQNWIGNTGNPLFYLREDYDKDQLILLMDELNSLIKDYKSTNVNQGL